MHTTPTRFRMNPALTPGPVELTVADLTRSLRYYTGALGLRLLTQDTHSARLGVPGRPLVVLSERPGVPPAPPSSPGLSHFALVVPDRAELAHFVRHSLDLNLEFTPVAHGTTDSCYLTDPDGHGIEVYRDCPREEWPWEDGMPKPGRAPLDVPALLREPGADAPFGGLPEDTVMGHFQLKVTDPGLVASESFYRDVLGLGLLAHLENGPVRMLFFGAGDDQAQFALTNRFSLEGSEPAPEASARLVAADVLLPAPDDVRALARHLGAIKSPYELQADRLSVRDPSGNLLRFMAQPG